MACARALYSPRSCIQSRLIKQIVIHCLSHVLYLQVYNAAYNKCASNRSAPYVRRHISRYTTPTRCMFQEVCPGAMVMHSGVVVGLVSSNFAYPAFIRSWSGDFICIRNSRSGQEFSLLDLCLFFFFLFFVPVERQQNYVLRFPPVER